MVIPVMQEKLAPQDMWDFSPPADAGWIGEAGPGPSYLDPGSGGPENDFTNRNTEYR